MVCGEWIYRDIVRLWNDSAVGLFHAKKESEMLVLSRMVEERIQIGDDITLLVMSIRGGKVRIGIEAPKSIKIMRHELISKPQENGEDDAKTLER